MSCSKTVRVRFHRTVAAALLAAILGGCTAAPVKSTKPSAPAVSTTPRLSLERVREIAVARTRANGFDVKVSDPWTFALQFNDNERIWAAILWLPGKTPFQLYINDATGEASFLAPEIHPDQRFAVGPDWLESVADVLSRTRYPIDLEEFMRAAHFAGAEFTMGGTTADGRPFLDYAMRRERDTPARFEVRCYYETPRGSSGPKIVTAAELSYTDAKVNRYLLTPTHAP